MPDSAPIVPSEAKPPAPRRRRAKPSELLDQAQTAFEAGSNGTLDRSAVDAVVVKTRRGMRAAAPFVASALLDKALRGRKSPVDTKAAMFLLQGSGVTQSGAPVTEEERRKIDLENESLARMSVEDLARRVHEECNINTLDRGAALAATRR